MANIDLNELLKAIDEIQKKTEGSESANNQLVTSSQSADTLEDKKIHLEKSLNKEKKQLQNKMEFFDDMEKMGALSTESDNNYGANKALNHRMRPLDEIKNKEEQNHTHTKVIRLYPEMEVKDNLAGISDKREVSSNRKDNFIHHADHLSEKAKAFRLSPKNKEPSLSKRGSEEKLSQEYADPKWLEDLIDSADHLSRKAKALRRVPLLLTEVYEQGLTDDLKEEIETTISSWITMAEVSDIIEYIQEIANKKTEEKYYATM